MQGIFGQWIYSAVAMQGTFGRQSKSVIRSIVFIGIGRIHMLRLDYREQLRIYSGLGNFWNSTRKSGCLEYRNRLQIKEQTNIFVYTQK